MKLLLSTALFPNIDYFASIAKFGDPTIEIHETYPKQSYRNRYQILSPNGVISLSLAINKLGIHNCPSSKVEISYAENWLKLHWKSLETAYNSSPFFLYYKDDIYDILNARAISLIALNKEILNYFLDVLDLNNTPQYTQEFLKDSSEYLDYKNLIHPKKNPLFQEYIPYVQVFSEKFPFQPNLSILDLLFNMGPESGDYIERQALQDLNNS